jgi:hypothetical protein
MLNIVKNKQKTIKDINFHPHLYKKTNNNPDKVDLYEYNNIIYYPFSTKE